MSRKTLPNNNEVWESSGYEKGRKTRQLIVDKASRLFATYGYAATSIDQIGIAAGLTKGAVYGHFGQKRQIYIACLESNLRFFREQVIVDASLSREESLASYLRWLGSKLSRKAIVRSFLIQMIRDEDDALKSDLILDLMMSPFEQLRSLVAGLNDKIEPSACAFILFSTLLLDADLHTYYVLMAHGSTETHNIDTTVSRLVSMVKFAR